MAVKKAPMKKAAKKVAAKKAPAKKASAKKARAKKAPAKKAAAKKAPAKKAAAPVEKATAPAPAAPAPKTPATKTATKKVETTSIIARVDVGFGNSLFIRGEGAGLSWDKGTALENVSPYEWSFTSTSAEGDVTFKFLINDEIWAEGDDLTVAPGESSVSSPVFDW
jgi:hypothetical protein